MFTATRQQNHTSPQQDSKNITSLTYVGNIKIPFQELYCPKFSQAFQLFTRLICKMFMNIIFLNSDDLVILFQIHCNAFKFLLDQAVDD